jgi:hypothetical protein
MNFKTEDDYVNYFKSNELYSTDTMEEILNKVCFNYNNNLIIDYKIFKKVASPLTYDAMFKHIENAVRCIVTNFSNVYVHISMKSLSITDIDSHRVFLTNLINYYNTNYPNILNAGYIYLAPSIFVQVFSIFSVFIDKETRKKVNIVEKKKQINL